MDKNPFLVIESLFRFQNNNQKGQILTNYENLDPFDF